VTRKKKKEETPREWGRTAIVRSFSGICIYWCRSHK